jgi:hypothetical protein
MLKPDGGASGSGKSTIERPGFRSARLIELMRAAIDRCGLDLSGLTVLTEAATGAYCVTPIIAALAKAKRVHAVTRASRYGTVAEVEQATMDLARLAGVHDRIAVMETVPPDVSDIDIVTNSGHLRPIHGQLIDRLPQRAVIGLMFEAWEFRESDIDLAACRRRNIPIVGINERHPAVDVFSYLGSLCVNMLHLAGAAVYGNRLALLCDNDFGPFIERSLKGEGASVSLFANASDLTQGPWDAIIVSLKPGPQPRINAADAKHLARIAPTAIVAQLWGDIDRTALSNERLALWPPEPPHAGHMGVLLSAVGPEPIVRLQCGGLRAAEWVYRRLPVAAEGMAQIL